MDKYLFLIITILFYGHIFASESPVAKNKERSDAESAAIETFGSIILSTSLPRLPEDFCDEVIACAPERVKKRMNIISQLRTLKTVANRDNQTSPEEEVLRNYMIFHGLPGGGKTTLARVIAQRLGNPFVIVKSAQLGNEFAHSVESGIRRVGEVAAKAKATVIFDEADCLWKPKKENLKKETANIEAQAVWLFLDEMQMNNRFFMATSNDLTNMPEPLQDRFHCCLYEIPTIHLNEVREKVLRSFLKTKHSTQLENYLDDLMKKTSGLSHRQMRKIVSVAYEEALSRDISNPDIQFNDFIQAINILKRDRKTTQKKHWANEDIFNYTVQTISATASVVAIVNVVLSYLNTKESLKYAAQGITYQGQGIALQGQGVGLQAQGIELQTTSVALQGEGVSLQEKGVSLQEDGLECQKASLSLARWSNPLAAVGSGTWGVACWTARKSGAAALWSAKTTLNGACWTARQTANAAIWSAKNTMDGVKWALSKEEQK